MPDDHDSTPRRRHDENLEIAREIGDAARGAEQLLQSADGRQRDAQSLEDALRRLTSAVRAVTAPLDDAPTAGRLTPDELASLTDAGIPPHVFTDDAHRRFEDWLVWSAIYLDEQRRRLDAIAELPLTVVAPGLVEAIAAIPDNYDDVDKHTILCTPDTDLDGLSPIQWLLTRNDPDQVVELLKGLEWFP